MTLRSTYTYALLDVSAATYDEIEKKLREAGYDHAFNDKGEIDMHGIALARPAELGTPDENTVDAMAWAYLNAVHSHLPEERRPMSWSDFSDEQIARIKAGVLAAWKFAKR